MEHRWNEIDKDRKTEELGEKPVPVPLRPPQIPHGLTWDRTPASAVGGLSHGTALPYEESKRTIKIQTASIQLLFFFLQKATQRRRIGCFYRKVGPTDNDITSEKAHGRQNSNIHMYYILGRMELF
jgi:hypothetical protein